MRKNENTEHIEGRIYEHELALKTVQNQASDNYGKEFISGTLDIAVDEEGLNVIPVHYTYVTKTTKAGKTNSTFTALKKIIDGAPTWLTDGKENATKVQIDTALALNDFFTQDDTHVSLKVNEGGFVTIVNNINTDETERNKFKTDIVINGVQRIEADPEKNIEEDYVVVRGVVFNFRNAILPVEFVVRNKDGMKFFENLEASPSNPIYTSVWGRINCNTIVTKKVEESAFGQAAVQTYERKVKEWVITGTKTLPYDFGDEKVLTTEELVKAMQDREVYLADVKKRSDEYRAQKAAGTSPAPSTVTIAPGGFNF